MTIGPGEFGFGEINFDGMGSAGDDAEFAFERLPPADNAGEVVDLRITEFRVVGDEIIGTVVNPHLHDVENIEIRSLCVEDSGVLLDTAWDVIDRREIEAGGQAEFETDLPGDLNWGDDCADQELFLLAIGQIAQLRTIAASPSRQAIVGGAAQLASRNSAALIASTARSCMSGKTWA